MLFPHQININSYLVGTYDENNSKKLTLYKFKTENAILGTTQLDTLVEQDENISKELDKELDDKLEFDITIYGEIYHIQYIYLNNLHIYYH